MQTRRRLRGGRTRKSLSLRTKSRNNGSNDKLEAFFDRHPKGSLHSLYSHFMVSPRGRIAIFLITKSNELIDLSFRLKNGKLVRFMESKHRHIKEYRNASILERFKYKPWNSKNDSDMKGLEKRFLTMYPLQDNSIERYVTPENTSIQSLDM